MATGGHGGIRPGPYYGTIRKTTNRTEVLFYQKVYRPGPLQAAPALPQIPAMAQHLPNYYGHITFHTTPIIVIEDIGSGFSTKRMMDVKIGSATASYQELLTSGMNDISAMIKKLKMVAADIDTKSASRDFRIVHYTGGPSSRRKTARADPTASINAFFGGSGMLKWQARLRLYQLEQAVVSTPDVVCIAASVLFCYDADAPHILRMRLIDFGHSYAAYFGPTPFLLCADNYRNNFITGLQKLRNAIV